MKRKPFILIVLVAAVLLVFYVSSLKSQLNAAYANQENYKDKINNLTNVQESEALQANKDFLKRFFTYSNTKERYENIEPLMTSRGFQSTYPSGASIPEKGSEVESSANNFKVYEMKISKTESEYINEFDLSTKYNGVSDTTGVMVKTKLIFVEKQGWKVDEVEFLGQSSNN